MFGKDSSAITLLKNDHRAVEKLFEQFSNAEDNQEKVDLARELCQALMLHAHIEERIFYPSLQGKVKQSLLDEAFVEHGMIKELIDKIDGARPSDHLFSAHVQVLKEYVKHHVREEEDRIMPEAEASGVDLDTVGKRLEALKSKLRSRLEQLAPEPGQESRVELLQMDGRGIRHH